MHPSERELLVCRITAGTFHLRLARGGLLLVRPPTRPERCLAQEKYQEVYEEATAEGLYADDELLTFLLDNDLWADTDDKMLGRVADDIEEFKHRLFVTEFKEDERKHVRGILASAKQKQLELLQRRHAYDHLACHGAAALARARFLFCLVAKPADPLVPVAAVADEGLARLAEARPDEAQLRELARTDPWQSVWNAREAASSVFGRPAADLTEEQRSLVAWSRLYEQARQHPECPRDEAFGDDDVFDGWLIDQKRKRKQVWSANDADRLTGNEKIRQADEIFIPANTRTDALAIDGFNDPTARATKRARMDFLHKRGQVEEVDMPDTSRRLQMAAARQYAASVTGSGRANP